MSHAMKLLQAKCGVSADGDFGPNTARAIAQHYELNPDVPPIFWGKHRMKVVGLS
jgi:hypothetical protein